MNVDPLIPDLAKAYLNIFKEAKRKREFFGLRDFYRYDQAICFSVKLKKPVKKKRREKLVHIALFFSSLYMIMNACGLG